MDAAGQTRPNAAMFKTLRRLHGHNLESQGLNDLSEAFQNFMTRAKFFSFGRLRRTWSHSAVEFMKYRRLLPMLVADEHSPGSAFDDFDLHSPTAGGGDRQRVVVASVSPKATRSQVHSFFTQFGKVQACQPLLLAEDGSRRQTMYATVPKSAKKALASYCVTFRDEAGALRALESSQEELVFYGQQMTVSAYKCKSDQAEEPSVSRSSSLASIGTVTSQTSPFDALPPRVLECIMLQLEPVERVRLERVDKRWLEAAAKAWSVCERLSFTGDRILANAHLSALLARCGQRLRVLDVSGARENRLHERALSELARLCPNLEELDLTGLAAPSPAALAALSSSLMRLRRVAYRGNPAASDVLLGALLHANGRNIRAVDVRGSGRRLRGRFLALLGGELEEALLDGCAGVDDGALEDVCTRSRALRQLRLDGCYALTDEGIGLVSRHLDSLTSLSLCGDGFVRLTAAGLMAVARVRSLRQLRLQGNPLVANELLEALAQGAPALEALSIAFAGSDDTIASSALAALARLHALLSLDVSGLAAVDSAAMGSICRGCPRLTSLAASSCCYLADEGVGALEQLAHLAHVDLSGCILVTHTSIQALVDALNARGGEEKVTLRVGGTLCEPGQLRSSRKRTRVQLDFSHRSDESSQWPTSVQEGGHSDEEEDGCGVLSAHRSFVSDALCGEEDAAATEAEADKWAEREARRLGLLDALGGDRKGVGKK